MRQSMAAPRTSSIPAPSHHRQSLAPSRLQRPSSVERDVMASASRSAARRSYATPSTQQRRTSVYSRGPSMGMSLGGQGGGGQGGMGMGGSNQSGPSSFFASTSATNAITQDPRPLRDPTYKARISAEIMDFLQSNNYEMTMKCNLNPNFAKNPTAKDFTNIFRFFYMNLDPHYQFGKSLDTEVLGILKTLRYPFVSSITKSQLAAVGSSNSWPMFLGMLHWMMELVITVNRVNDPAYDSVAEEAGFDPEPDRIQLNYFSEAYQAWINLEDDLTPYEQAMSEQFAQREELFIQELEQLEARNKELREEVQELEESARPLEQCQQHKEVLESDIRKFTDWITKSTAKYQRALTALESIRTEIENGKRELQDAENDRDSLQAAVDRQGLTPADIDRINTEREKLSKTLLTISERLNVAQSELASRESDCQSKLERVERARTRYNSLAYNVGVVPSTKHNAGGRNFELRLFPGKDFSDVAESDKLLADPDRFVGYSPAELVDIDLRHDIRPWLLDLKKNYTKKIHEADEELMRVMEGYDRVMEQLQELDAEVETLRVKKTAADDEYNELKQSTITETNASNSEIEKLERELQSMRVHMSTGLLSLEQRSQAVRIEYDQMVHQCEMQREKLHSEVERIINDIVNFKVHIQKSLEDYEELTGRERDEAVGIGEER